jgi:hypothetical protein
MRTISLDQNIVSTLVKSGRGKDPVWTEIHHHIKKGVELGYIICPFSKETIIETAALGDSVLQRDIVDFVADTSRNTCWKEYWRVLGEELLSIARPSMRPYALEVSPWRAEAITHGTALGRTAIASSKTRMRNNVAAFDYPTGRDKWTVDEFHRGIVKERVADLFRQVQRMGHNKPLHCGDTLNLATCEYLLEQKLTPTEAGVICDRIRDRTVETIPVVFFHGLVSAISEYDQHPCRPTRKRYEESDEFDRFRLATALSVSCIVITEVYWCEKLRQHPAVSNCGVQLFSSRDADSILTCLKDMTRKDAMPLLQTTAVC